MTRSHKCHKCHKCHKQHNKCCKSKPRLITVGPSCKDNYPTVQKALDKLRTPCVINGPTTIKVEKGEYEVTNLDNLFAGSPGDFLITGDERTIAGFAVAHGLRINLLGLTDLGTGVASITLVSNVVTITATGLDLTTQELEAGDKIYITGTSGDTEEYVINTINVGSLELDTNISATLLADSGVNGLTVTFQPNVKFTSDAVLIETAMTLKGITWEGSDSELFEIRSKIEINNMVISFYRVFVGRSANISNTGFDGSPVTLLNFFDMGYNNSVVDLKGLCMSGFGFAITNNSNTVMSISNGFHSGRNFSEPLFILLDNDNTSVQSFDINVTSRYRLGWVFGESKLEMSSVNILGGEPFGIFLDTSNNSFSELRRCNIELEGKVQALYLADGSSTITLRDNTYTYDPANVPGIVYDAKGRSFIKDTDDHSSETAATSEAYKSVEGSFIRAPDNHANRWPGPVLEDIGGQVLP